MRALVRRAAAAIFWLTVITWAACFAGDGAETDRAAAGGSVTDALRTCLTGRCRQGETDPGKLPPYNLGSGYTCDAERLRVYAACMRRPGATREACLVEADAARDQCKRDPCPVVYRQCKEAPCTRTSNRYDCWDRRDGTLVFGYWEWVDNKWKFIPVSGDRVPDADWEAHCRGEETRCQAGMTARPGDAVPPISQSFCSAACYGHNCHHAADHVCKCLERESGGAAHPKVIVLDGGATGCPSPTGNIYHSMITIDHPTTAGKRCIIESQSKCSDPAVDERCCYSTIDQFKNLVNAGCPLVRSGPLKQPMTLYPFSLYTCDEFLERQGTCGAEVRSRSAIPTALALETTEEDDLLPCAMACGDGGLAPAVGDAYGACPEGTICRLPEDVSCECSVDEPPTCSGDSCPPDEPKPTYRGECVPVPEDPDPDAGPQDASPDAGWLPDASPDAGWWPDAGWSPDAGWRDAGGPES